MITVITVIKEIFQKRSLQLCLKEEFSLATAQQVNYSMALNLFS